MTMIMMYNNSLIEWHFVLEYATGVTKGHTHTPAGSLPSIVYKHDKQHGQTEIQSWLSIIPQLAN